MIKDTPAVLVVARFRGSDVAGEVARGLAGQTYPRARLVFITTPGDDAPALSGLAAEACPADQLAPFLEKSDADYLLSLPDDSELHATALEKLLLSLHLAPDQAGVTDASHGLDGLLLIRLGTETTPTALRWLESRVKWLTEIQRRKLSFFHLDETLTLESPGTAADFGVVEKAFTRLPILLPSARTGLSEDELWNTPNATAQPQNVLLLVSSLDPARSLIGQLQTSGHRLTIVTAESEPHSPLAEVFPLRDIRPAQIPRFLRHLAKTRGCGRVVLFDSPVSRRILPWLRAQLPDANFFEYVPSESLEEIALPFPSPSELARELAATATELEHTRRIDRNFTQLKRGQEQLLARRDKVIEKLERQLAEARAQIEEAHVAA